MTEPDTFRCMEKEYPNDFQQLQGSQENYKKITVKVKNTCRNHFGGHVQRLGLGGLLAGE